MFADVIRLLRPRQWTKNLAVFAGIIFSGTLTNHAYFLKVCLAFVALCLVSGGLYAFNDVIDADRDCEHPVKCKRPIAAGRISKGAGLAMAGVAVALGLGLSAMLGWGFLGCVVGYVLLHVTYTEWLKHQAIVDMLVIATGFVIRAVAGAVVIAVPVSPWLVLCTGLLALFLVAAKRRHEAVLLREHSSEHRPVLSAYTPELLDSFMVTLSAATVTSYALYTFFEARAPHYSMMLTIPFVIYGVLRYQYLVLSQKGGGEPEEVFLSDRPIIIVVVVWVLSAMFALYALPLLVK